MIQSFLIAIAISMDSLSVGIAYGMKNIKVPLYSLVILDFISILLLSIGFFLGNLLTKFIPTRLIEFIGFCILFIIGIWFLIQAWLNKKYPRKNHLNPQSIAVISIDSLGIVINILRDPSKVDLNISGVIDTKEAILLGIALAIDSLAIGVAVSLSNMTTIILALFLVGIMNLIFLLSGIYLGKNLVSNSIKERTCFIPGSILLILAIIRLFT